MNYSETVNWMFSQLPMYQQQGASAFRKNLDNTYLLADHLGNPEKELKAIHVAGTNGKGSTSHMLASVLMEAGYKVGLFTSPHLKDFRERIKINGAMISEDYITKFIAQHKSFFEENNLSFFEMTVGLGFRYFADENVDIAIIETGLGGRLDSTNIITPLVSLITNIGFDHTQFLGNSYTEIAFEKAGIIKPSVPVVIGEYNPETRQVFADVAKLNQCPICFASDLIKEQFESDLNGNYQLHNKRSVVQTLKVLAKQTEFKASTDHIRSGLLNVVQNTGLQGRWQQLKENPTVICDTAHNKEGLLETLSQVMAADFDQLHLVLGFVNDKSLDEILPLFPSDAKYYFCKPNLSRGLEADILKDEAEHFGLYGKAYRSVLEAYTFALENAGASDFIYIGGSTFVVAEIL